jgi:hypothetical protein
MHEREKSDPAIGAGKPTNKAEASAHAEHGVSDAAELVEQRAGAKGNADEQSTHRTQGRERVSQALERVRKAARLRKEEKFTALLHHITTSRHSAPSVTISGVSGCARCGAAIRRTASHGSGSQSWPMTSSRNPSCASRTGSCKHSQCCESTAEEPGAGNLHAGFCGNGGRATASRDPVGGE